MCTVKLFSNMRSWWKIFKKEEKKIHENVFGETQDFCEYRTLPTHYIELCEIFLLFHNLKIRLSARIWGFGRD